MDLAPTLPGSLEQSSLTAGYASRTRANVRDFDCTVWFGDASSAGGITTLRACRAIDRPVYLVEAGVTRPSDLTTWLVAGYFEVVNVAGNRESTTPGIGVRVERFLLAALRSLAI